MMLVNDDDNDDDDNDKHKNNNNSLLLVGNEALIGSAISITSFSNLDTILTNITMIDNNAKIAGTFFWLCKGVNQANLSSCQEPRYDNLVFENNIAPYGESFATQPIHIRTSNEYNVNVYGGPLQPSVILTLYDFYGHKAVSDNLTITTASVIGYNCDDFVGTIEGNTIEVANRGTVTFSDVSANCIPNGNLVVQFTSQPSGFLNTTLDDITNYNFITTSLLNFRQCSDGENYMNGACTTCENGKYTFTYSKDQSCRKCPSEAIDCYANNINLARGYWRISAVSDDILKCPYLGCKGGNGIIINLYINYYRNYN
jgi:hypothetical protein